MVKWSRLAAFPPLLTLFLLAQSVMAVEADDILRQVDQNFFRKSFQSFSVITNYSADGREHRLTVYVAKQADGKAVALVVSPESLRGRAALRLGDVVWTHIPGEIEPRKGGLAHSLVGGLFNNYDILGADYRIDHTVQLLAEDRTHFILELTPRAAGLPYHHAEMKVDKKLMLPDEIVQLTDGKLVLKKIQFTQNADFNKGWVRPAQMETSSEVNVRYRSVWHWGRLEERTFPGTFFTVEFLPSVGTILK